MPEKKVSKLEEALELKNRLDNLLKEAKEEALGQIQTHLATLRGLGFSYEIVEGSGGRRRASSARGGKGQRVCGICGNPGHNARTCPKKKA